MSPFGVRAPCLFLPVIIGVLWSLSRSISPSTTSQSILPPKLLTIGFVDRSPAVEFIRAVGAMKSSALFFFFLALFKFVRRLS